MDGAYHHNTYFIANCKMSMHDFEGKVMFTYNLMTEQSYNYSSAKKNDFSIWAN